MVDHQILCVPSPPFPFWEQMDTFVNPLRSSMRNVSNAVKSFPDSLAEGMNKMSDNMGRMSERLGQDIKQSIFKVTKLLDILWFFRVLQYIPLPLNGPSQHSQLFSQVRIRLPFVIFTYWLVGNILSLAWQFI